jgi:hypothetical protein
MNPNVGSNLRNLEMNKVSSAENVEARIIIGYRPLKNTNARNGKPEHHYKAEQ